MKTTHVLAALAAFALPATALAQPYDKFERKGPGEYVHEYKDGWVEVKRERKPGEYKEELKRGDDVFKFERKRDGSWKEEIKDGSCEIKRERTSSGEYKEERKCG